MADLIPWLPKIRNGEIKLILGSSSKPRKAIFEQLGVPFSIMVSSFAEDLDKNLFRHDFSEYPLETSREKSKDLIGKLGTVERPTILITCDTVVLRDKKHIIEKPSDEEHAIKLLQSLSGVEHEVVTGVIVSLIRPGADIHQAELKSITCVQFAVLSEETIRAYVATGEPFNKAGGYGIQGLGELLIEQVRGSFTNVVGVPLHDVARASAQLLAKHYSE